MILKATSLCISMSSQLAVMLEADDAASVELSATVVAAVDGVDDDAAVLTVVSLATTAAGAVVVAVVVAAGVEVVAEAVVSEFVTSRTA